MANEIRRRQNFLGGQVDDNPLTAGATVLTSAGLSAMVAIGATEHMMLVIDPDGVTGLSPEIVMVTAHAGGADTATIARGQGGTAARQHDAGISWVHGPVTSDWPTTIHVRDEKASGTAGGTFTAGAWQVRTLNTVALNEIAGASLAANEVTLPAGLYEVEGSAPGHLVNYHQARLYNVTGAAVLLLGTTVRVPSGTSLVVPSVLRGRFPLGVTSNIRLEHRCSTTAATDGFGIPATFGNNEVYADLIIRKVA